MDYRLFIAVDVVDFLQTLRRSQRQEMLAHFRRLRNSPGRYADYQDSDEVGRRVEVSVFGGFAIYYWVDEADQHVKILKLATAD